MAIRLTENQLRNIIRNTIRESYDKNRIDEGLGFWLTGGGLGWGGGRRQSDWSSSGKEIKNVDRPKPTMLISNDPSLSEELDILNALALKATYQPEAVKGLFGHVKLEEYKVSFVFKGWNGEEEFAKLYPSCRTGSMYSSERIKITNQDHNAFINNDFGDLNVSSISSFNFDETYPGTYRGTGSARVNIENNPLIGSIVITWSTR